MARGQVVDYTGDVEFVSEAIQRALEEDVDEFDYQKLRLRLVRDERTGGVGYVQVKLKPGRDQGEGR